MGLLFRFWQDLYRGKRFVCTVAYILFLSMAPSTVLARRYPYGVQGAHVVYGNVSFGRFGNTTTITASDRSVINYSSFDVARSDIVRFIQPSAQATVLNRISSARPTHIEGTLLANGRVFFVNPAGVYIGEGAQINVNQLVASGLNISNADFINGQMNFTGGDGTVTNQGDIMAEKVTLLGRHIVNSGHISCPEGHVIMVAGERVFLRELDSEIMVEIDPSTGFELQDSPATMESKPGVLNQGHVEAAGGRITLGAGDIYSQAVSNIGSVSASVTADQAGSIEMMTNAGQISNAGSIEAKSDGGKGGSVHVKADEVINSGTIDVTGQEGGTVVLEAIRRLGQLGVIQADGTDAQGGDVSLYAGETAALSAESLTTANAGSNGDGGEITVFSPDTALFWSDARIEAQGGTDSGDGGFVEVSGLNHVEINGEVDASADHGESGTFLLDPTDVTIQNNAGIMDPGENGAFTPSNEASTVSDDAIEDWLNNGTSVEITTVSTKADEGNIRQNVDAQINKTSGANATITLNADHDIDLRGGIVSESGKLEVLLDAQGDVTLSSEISTNGGDFESSGVHFDNRDGPISTSGGGVRINHEGNVAIDAINAEEGSVSISAGGSLGEGEPDEVLDIIGGKIDLIAQGGTIGPIEVKAKVELNATTTAEGCDIIIHSGQSIGERVTWWDMPVGHISAEAGNVTLEAKAIRDAMDDSSEPLVDIVGNTIELIAKQEGIGTPFPDSKDGALQDGVLEIIAGEKLLADSEQGLPNDLQAANILVSSIGDLRLGQTKSNGAIDIEATGDITVSVGEEIEARQTLRLHSGTDGTGNLSFESGAELSSKDIVLRAGDGLDGVSAMIDHSMVKLGDGDPDPDAEWSLTLRQDASIEETPSQDQLEPDSVERVNLILRSDDGSVTSTTADEWGSVEATAHDGITLAGAGDITTNALKTNKGNITVHSTQGDLIVNGDINARWQSANESLGGGVELLADAGRIYTSGAGTLNVSITGYSDDLWAENTSDRMGVELPGGQGRAGIVIISRDSLHLGPKGKLTTDRNPRDSGPSVRSDKDDRNDIYFQSGQPGDDRAGDAIDVSVYLASTGRDVTIDSKVNIFDSGGGALVVDARDKVVFGDGFAEHWVNFGFPRLEVVSRTIETFNQAARYETLPGAGDILEGKYPGWIINAARDRVESNGDTHQEASAFVWSKYVLRGGSPGQVLAYADVFPEPPGEWRDFPRQDQWVNMDLLEWKFFTNEYWKALPQEAGLQRYFRNAKARGVNWREPKSSRDLLGWLVRGAPPVPLGPARQLETGDIVITARNALGVVKFDRETDVLVEPNTHIKIGSMAVSIEFGKIWYLGEADPNLHFIISTPNGDITINSPCNTQVSVTKDVGLSNKPRTMVKVGPVLEGRVKVHGSGLQQPSSKDVEADSVAYSEGKGFDKNYAKADVLKQTREDLKDRLEQAPSFEFYVSKYGPWPYMVAKYVGDMLSERGRTTELQQ